MERTITFNEFKGAISRLKNNKAPGIDNFKVEIVKELWKQKPEAILCLINNCFSQGAFTKQWKVANLRIILKDENRDRTLLNSYCTDQLRFCQWSEKYTR
ncbi:unnamed protein product, partial [Heterotrigona itama]